MLLSCYQSVLASALNGVGRPGAAARNSILCGVVQLGCTFFLMGLPGVGLRGYVAGFLASAALGVLLNWWAVRRATGLRAQIFQWCTAPALSALLMGLVINLLFQVLRRAGLEALPAALACRTRWTSRFAAACSASASPRTSAAFRTSVTTQERAAAPTRRRRMPSASAVWA